MTTAATFPTSNPPSAIQISSFSCFSLLLILLKVFPFYFGTSHLPTTDVQSNNPAKTWVKDEEQRTGMAALSPYTQHLPGFFTLSWKLQSVKSKWFWSFSLPAGKGLRFRSLRKTPNNTCGDHRMGITHRWVSTCRTGVVAAGAVCWEQPPSDRPHTHSFRQIAAAKDSQSSGNGAFLAFSSWPSPTSFQSPVTIEKWCFKEWVNTRKIWKERKNPSH